MLYASYLILVFVLLIDLIFYVPIYINIYYDNQHAYFYIYSLMIIKIDKYNNKNLMKNKIDMKKFKDANKEDLKIIQSITIDKIFLRIPEMISYQYSYIIYPLYNLNLIKTFDYKLADEFKLYIKVKMNIVNILHKLIQIRRIKNERTSN